MLSHWVCKTGIVERGAKVVCKAIGLKGCGVFQGSETQSQASGSTALQSLGPQHARSWTIGGLFARDRHLSKLQTILHAKTESKPWSLGIVHIQQRRLACEIMSGDGDNTWTKLSPGFATMQSRLQHQIVVPFLHLHTFWDFQGFMNYIVFCTYV